MTKRRKTKGPLRRHGTYVEKEKRLATAETTTEGTPANSKSSPAYAEQPSRSRPRLRDSFKVSSWSKKQKE